MQTAAMSIRRALAASALTAGVMPALAQVLYLGKDEQGRPMLDSTPTPEWRRHFSVQQPVVQPRRTPTRTSNARPAQAAAGANPATPKTEQSDPPRPAPVHAEAILFAADWCGYCRRARHYLQANRIAYQDVNVDSRQGAAVFEQVSPGSRAIPLLLVGHQQVRGFSAATYDRIFRAPVR